MLPHCSCCLNCSVSAEPVSGKGIQFVAMNQACTLANPIEFEFMPAN